MWNADFQNSDTAASDTGESAGEGEGDSTTSSSDSSDSSESTGDTDTDTADTSTTDEGTGTSTTGPEETSTTGEPPICDFFPKGPVPFHIDPGNGICPQAGNELFYLRVGAGGFNEFDAGTANGAACGFNCGECFAEGAVGIPGLPELEVQFEQLAAQLEGDVEPACLEVEVTGVPTQFGNDTCEYAGMVIRELNYVDGPLVFGHSDPDVPLAPGAMAITQGEVPMPDVDGPPTAACPCDVFHEDPGEIGCCEGSELGVREMAVVYQGQQYDVDAPHEVTIADQGWVMRVAQSEVISGCEIESQEPQFSWVFVIQG